MTFTAPRTGPCESYTTWEEIAGCGTAPDLDADMQDLVVEVASETAWGLLGERFTGACERTVMPCWRGRCSTWLGYSGGYIGLGYVPSSEGCGSCSCASVARLDLGALPVWGVSSVVIDGVELDNTDGVAYRVEDWRYLVRMDGDSWPRCQGTWEVTLTYGSPIPARARRIASLIGLEFAKQCNGDVCGLDAQTASYDREGLHVQLAAPGDIVARGFTGIRTIDLLLVSLGGRGGGGAMVDLSTASAERVASWDLADVDA